MVLYIKRNNKEYIYVRESDIIASQNKDNIKIEVPEIIPKKIEKSPR